MRYVDKRFGAAATVPLKAATRAPGDLVIRLPKAGIAIISKTRSLYEAQFHEVCARVGSSSPTKRAGARPRGVRAL